MGRNIFNQPPKETAEAPAPSPAPAKPSKLAGSVGGLRESLREITANSIRDIDPERIDMGSLRDRLGLEDASIDELAESIRKHGQQVPIMVRPSEQPDRYRIVYGRRRLAAIRKIGGAVKAIVRTLDDDASLIAQGQENNLRLDPSFIEKALFIKEMQEAGYKPSVVQDALGLTRQGVSNHRVVIEQLPDELIRIIGPAHGIGRRQWSDLAALTDKVPLIVIAQEVVSSCRSDLASSERFHAVFNAASSRARDSAKPKTPTSQPTALTDENGVSLGTLATDSRSVNIKITRKDNPEFSQWVAERGEALLRQAYTQWQNESGVGS